MFDEPAQISAMLPYCRRASLRTAGGSRKLWADGPALLLQNIVDLRVPELQRRGRFRTAYTGRTWRENLAS